jgi:CMP/dCMP kinase
MAVVVDSVARALTIGGLPGTGTTTACRKLTEVLGLEYFYAGQIFRDLAKERNMTLEAFGRYAEEHDEVDRDLDRRQVELLKKGPIILEGRLSGWLAEQNGVDAHKVWFHCEPHVRAERVVRREGGDVDERMAEMRVREASERKRYLAYYGHDISDLSLYDQVIDTTDRTPLEIVEDIVAAYRRTRRPRWAFWRR